ncbi:MAG: family transcriptional regulator [Actinomycetia bacterium]|nr:family transcriptional regulator [Actinomycetes bacterium]
MLGQALRLIHTGRAPTRSVLTSALGVSRATAGTLVSELQALRLIQVQDAGPEPAGAHQQGRPSHRLSLDPAGPVAIAAEIHADGYQVALVGLGAQVVAAQSRMAGIAGDPALALAEVARAAARLLADTGRPCVGAGLAVPAAVASPDGVMVGQLGIDWPDGTPARDLFTEQLLLAGVTGPAGQPVSCSAANDINLAALAEHRHGAGRDASHLLMVATGNRGVGGALVLDGALYTGSGGLGMEAGHVSVDPGGRPCPCGSRGCLNVETDAARFLSDAKVTRPGTGGTDLARATGLLRHRRDDPAVRAAVSVLTERLAAGLAGLVNVLNPDRILLGGLHRDLLEADPGRLRAAVAGRSPWGRAAGVPLVPAALEHSALIGAAEIAWQPVLDNPALAPSPCGREEALIR